MTNLGFVSHILELVRISKQPNLLKTNIM